MLRKTAYAPIPKIPTKTIRALDTRENCGIAPCRLEIGFTMSSGESSLVKASLKVNAKKTRTPTSETPIERGFCPRGCVIRRWIQAYVATIKAQRNLGFDTMKVFTISGAPANFWPVWFQPRMSRVEVRTRASQKQAPSNRLLWVSVSG